MKAFLSTIKNSVNHIIHHSEFKAWLKSEQINPSDWVVINNSFIHRDVTTTKADNYLVLLVSPTGKFDGIHVGTGFNVKNDFKAFPAMQPNKPPLEPLTAAIEHQLDNLGHIVFMLVAYIQDDLIAEEEFAKATFSHVVWDPTQKSLFRVQGQRIIINSPYDEDALWDEYVAHCQKANIPLNVEQAAKDFGAVLDKLREQAEATLRLPDKTKRNWKSVTDEIIDVLKKQREEYEVALLKCKGKPEVHPEAFNQLLRISYNFASDAIPYLKLIVSICDLKPVILWSTIGEHYALSEAFRNLPWTRSKYKPSLKNYIDIIGDARNSAFHNIFPFSKALKFSLPLNAIEHAELRIFSEYRLRGHHNNELTFRDKELIDTLLEFTRARQRFVSSGFWKQNADVMDKTIELFEATSRVLKHLYMLTA